MLDIMLAGAIISLSKHFSFRILGFLSRRHLTLRVRLKRVSKDFLTTTSAVPTVNDTCTP